MLERAREFIKNLFPKADFAKLGPIGFGKKSRNVGKIVSLGSRGGETKIFRDDRSGLLKSFTDKFKKSLGPEAESLIAQDNDEIRETRQSLREAESQLKEAEKLSSEREKALQEVKDLRTKLDQTQARIDALHDEQGSTLESESELRRLRQRRKNLKTDFDNAKKEVAAHWRHYQRFESHWEGAGERFERSGQKKQPHFCLDCSDRLFLSSSKLLVRPSVFWLSTPGY